MNQPVGPPPSNGPPRMAGPPMGSSGIRPMMRNSAGSSGGSGATEADCSEVLNLLSPLIQEYEQSEGSKKPAQNAIGQLKTLEENLTKKTFSGSVVNQLKALLQHMEENNL